MLFEIRTALIRIKPAADLAQKPRILFMTQDDATEPVLVETAVFRILQISLPPLDPSERLAHEIRIADKTKMA